MDSSQLQDWVEKIGWMRIAAVGIASLLAVALLRKLFGRPRESKHHATVQCRCGWSGQVSRYKPVCPKCAAVLKAP